MTHREESGREEAELLELAHDAILVRELGTSRILYWNRGAERLYGWTRAEAVGHTSFELLQSRFPIPFEEVEAELDRTGRWEGELVQRRKGGSEVVVDSRWSLRRDAHGRPEAYLEINTDISDRRRSEQQRLALVREQAARAQAEASEQRISRILEDMGDAFLSLDAGWRFAYVNHQAETLLGQARADLLGRTLWTALPEFIGLGLQEQYRTLIGDRRDLAFETWYAPRRAWYSGRVVHGPEGISVYFRDTTERRREAEQRQVLEDVAAHLADTLDASRTLRTLAHLLVPRLADYAIFDLLTESGRLDRVATAHVDPDREPLLDMGRVYELSAADKGPFELALASGRPSLLDPVDVGWLARAMRSTPAQRQAVEQLGPRSCMLLPLVARGRTLGLLALVSAESGRHYDRRDLALAEEVARRSALAIDNARLYAAAQAALQEAEAAVRVRDDVLAAVSHDLKTPLTAVRGTADLLARRLSRVEVPDADRLRQGLDRIQGAAARMARMMDDLLDAARLQRGEPLELERAPVNLVELVRETVAEHQTGTDQRPLRCEAQVDELIGEWDGPRLRRVLDNLLGNALKYSPPDREVVVQVGPEQVRDQAGAFVRVIDRGIGIPAEDLPHVFERFHRARNVAQVRGTGLGLAGARQLVEQHGGTIDVQSQEGVGSTFTVHLPLAAGDDWADGQA